MKRLLLIIIYSIGASAISAQVFSPQVIASAGTSFSSPSVKMEFTIGEVVISTLGSTNVLTQGFHQPEIKILALENFTDAFTFNLYPNPTEQFVTIESSKEDEFRVHIYDGSGKAILISSIFSQKVTMDIELLSAGAYFMVITTKAGAPLHSYTVIKKSNY